jgi:hypothetical protein
MEPAENRVEWPSLSLAMLNLHVILLRKCYQFISHEAFSTMFGEIVVELLDLLHQIAVTGLIINFETVWIEKAPTHSGN